MKKLHLLPVLVAVVPLLGAGNGSTAPPTSEPPSNPIAALTVLPEEVCKAVIQYDEVFVEKVKAQMAWISQGSPLSAIVQDYVNLKAAVAFHCPPALAVSAPPSPTPEAAQPAPPAVPMVPVEAAPAPPAEPAGTPPPTEPAVPAAPPAAPK
jgi:hypothetical protein